jgi:hypothetical protein
VIDAALSRRGVAGVRIGRIAGRMVRVAVSRPTGMMIVIVPVTGDLDSLLPRLLIGRRTPRSDVVPSTTRGDQEDCDEQQDVSI